MATGLVREALIERDEWLTAPEYTRIERFFFQSITTSRGKWQLAVGTKLYQWLAGRYLWAEQVAPRLEALALNPP